MKDKQDDMYFIEMKKLLEEPSEEMMELVKPWIPTGKKVVAALSNGGKDKKQFDYIVITEEFIYFAILIQEVPGAPLVLRSVKFFKASDIIAVAFMLRLEDCGPQIRLMLSEGKRIKLIFKDREENRALIQRIATNKFFAQK